MDERTRSPANRDVETPESARPAPSDPDARLCSVIERGRVSPISTKYEIPPELEDAVADFTREHKARGALAERVVLRVKDLVRACVNSWLGHREAETLLGTIVRWTIRAYYGPGTGPRPTA